MTEATWVLLIVFGGIVALAVVGAFAYWRTTAHGKHPLVAQSVVLQLTDGSAVAGLMTRKAGGFLVLENARLYENGGDVPVDGSAWVPTDQVRWIQQARYQDGGER